MNHATWSHMLDVNSANFAGPTMAMEAQDSPDDPKAD